MVGTALTVSLDSCRDSAVLTVSGDVVDDADGLRRLVGVAMTVMGRRPALIDVCELYLYRHDGVQVLRGLMGQRAPGTMTVVLARTPMRRRLRGVFGPEMAWYPAEVRAPVVGMAASMAHRRRHLPPELRESLSSDPLRELLWAAALENSRPGHTASV